MGTVTASGKWDNWFLGLADYIGTASKDPSTKVGCVIVGADRRVVSTGYNGFARGCDDSPDIYADRPRKYRRVVHAERNALLFAARQVMGCTAYTTPFPPCAGCAAMLIQAGIVRVVAPKPSGDLMERWGEELAEAAQMFKEAGVELHLTESGQ